MGLDPPGIDGEGFGTLAGVGLVVRFYRAMHYAKRGLEIACRLSVRLSVTLVDRDHIG